MEKLIKGSHYKPTKHFLEDDRGVDMEWLDELKKKLQNSKL